MTTHKKRSRHHNLSENNSPEVNDQDDILLANTNSNHRSSSIYRSKSFKESNLNSPRLVRATFEDLHSHHDNDRIVASRNSNNSPIIDNPQPVYVCNCCCFSKELKPSYDYLTTLSSLFYLFNSLILLFGFACLGMGLWYRIDPKVYEIHKYIETQNFTYSGWIQLFGGFISCIMALIGFAAVGNQSQCLIILYLINIISILITFIGGLVLLLVHGLGSRLEQFLDKEIYNQIRRRAMTSESSWTDLTGAGQFLDFVQVKMQCCGAVDFTDYPKLGFPVPTTCYTIGSNYINAPGCGHAIRKLIDIRAGMSVGFLTASIFCQTIIVILTMCIFCSVYQWRAGPKSLETNSTRSGYMSTQVPRGQIVTTQQPISIISSNDRLHTRKWNTLDNIKDQQVQYNDLNRPRTRTPIIM